MNILERQFPCGPKAKMLFRVLILVIVFLASVTVGYAVVGVWCQC